MENNRFSPTEFINAVNQTFGCIYESVFIEGEVSNFKINQGKWVFFDLKDKESSISCFMTLYQMRMPLEDGMKILVKGVPKLTGWGKFSLTIQSVSPIGEGSLKKAFELLKKKLASEGLFDSEKKRALPEHLTKIGVISSTQAAGYADFIKIMNARWGGIKIQVAHTQVQGVDAPDQIIRALNYFNERGEVQIIAIIRGGGSADDLACFNDEALVRSIAASKIPVITGIGHEIDESLSDLAADLRGSTPSNAAEILTPDRSDVLRNVRSTMERLKNILSNRIKEEKNREAEVVSRMTELIMMKIVKFRELLSSRVKILEAHNPEKILKQGYALLSGELSIGNVVKITTFKKEIKAEVKEVNERN